MDFDYTTETIIPDNTNILTIGGTGGLEISIGTTPERPSSPVNGTIRYNTDLNIIEGYSNSTWTSIVNSGTVTSVNISGGTTGLSVSGGPITSSGTITLAGILATSNGGTGQSSYTVGDILYANTTSSLARLVDVATGNALISGGVNTAPNWGKIGLTTHVNGVLGIANGGTGLSTTPTNGQLLIGNGSGYALSTLTAGTGISVTNNSGAITLAATNNGTVTSVGLSLPAIFSVTGSPVTTSGTLTGSLVNQSANTFFVGPASGGPATPTFRTVSIDEMSDVIITSPSTNQVIAYNGTNWVNTGAVGSNATGTIGVSPSGGGTAWTLVSGNLYTANFVHNLGTTNLTITVYDTSDNSIVTPQNVSTPNTTTITVTAIGNTKTLKVVAVANGQSIVAGGSTPSSVITAYEGVTISAAATKLNFQGAGVGVVDAGSGTTNITIGQRYTYFAAALDTPVNSDFAVNSLAPMIADPTYISLNVRSFSNSVEQGVATLVSIPTGATKVTFKIRGRAQTAPGTASVVQPRIYYRLLPNNSAVPAWSAAQELANISIPTNANFQYGQQTVNLSTLGMTAGNMYQIELTRRVTGVTGTNLASAFLMAEFTMEFA